MGLAKQLGFRYRWTCHLPWEKVIFQCVIHDPCATTFWRNQVVIVWRIVCEKNVLHVLIHFGEIYLCLNMFDYFLLKINDRCAYTFWTIDGVSELVWRFYFEKIYDPRVKAIWSNEAVSNHVRRLSFEILWSMCFYILEKIRDEWDCLDFFLWKMWYTY